MVNKIKSLGINVSLEFSSDIEKINYYLNELRVEWIRLEFNFFSWLKNTFDFDMYDKFLENCFRSNIKILGLIMGNVPGNLTNIIYPAWRYPHVFDELENYLEFVNKLSERYKNILHWEIWNEQNTKRFWIKDPDVKDYIKLLLISAKKIRQNIPDAKIVFGGVAGNDQYKGVIGLKYGFFKDCLRKGASGLFDISNFHPYDINCYISIKTKENILGNSIKNFNSVFDYSRKLAKKTIWITEFGISRKHVWLSEKEIADIYYKLYLICLENKSILFIWDLIGPFGKDYGILNPETEFAILSKDQKPNKMFFEIVKRFSDV